MSRYIVSSSIAKTKLRQEKKVPVILGEIDGHPKRID